MQVRPLPSGRVMLSRPCERYCGPLRLPGQPPATSGFALIRRGGTPVVHWTGSPVVPCDAVRACRPCYPGGFPPARQLWWLWEHRPSPNVHRVGTLSLVTRLQLGSLRATACAVARPSGRSSGNLVLWVTPHTSLKLPGRTANSQGRTSTGKSHSIHGMRTLLPPLTYVGRRSTRTMVPPGSAVPGWMPFRLGEHVKHHGSGSPKFPALPPALIRTTLFSRPPLHPMPHVFLAPRVTGREGDSD